MRYDVIGHIWFTNLAGEQIGIVAINSNDHGWKAYIGIAPEIKNSSFCPMDYVEAHTQHIAREGSPVGKAIACAAFPQFNPETFLT